jgi:hypothetical protein
MRILFAVVAASTISMSAGAVFAQAERPAPRPTEKMPTIVVKGRRHAPQAVYVLQRSRVTADGLELKKSFVPRIVRSVDDPTF